jgi:hypothetical protein
MTIEKRKRGRPLNSCKPDSPLLAQVADILVSNPKMKPTTAIRGVLASPDPSPIRRLQSKWKQGSSNYLQQANMRAQLKSTETVSANRSNGTAQSLKRLRQEIKRLQQEIKIEELMAVYDPHSPKFRRESVSLTHLRTKLKEAKQQAEFEEFQETTKEKFQEATKNSVGFSSKAFEKQRSDLTEFVRQASRVHR